MRTGFSCSHVWFFKGLPRRLGYFAGHCQRDLEDHSYSTLVVVDRRGCHSASGKSLEDNYRELQTEYRAVPAKMGAAAIKELQPRRSDKLSEELREKMKTDPSVRSDQVAKRLRSRKPPQERPPAGWMILDVFRSSAELRAGALDGVPLRHFRFERPLSSRHQRNNRLKKIMELRAPDVMCATKE